MESNVVFEIKAYNQNPATEQDPYPETYSDDKFPTFTDSEQLNKFLLANPIYGKVFEYDADEYYAYWSDDDNIPDEWKTVPIPISQWEI